MLTLSLLRPQEDVVTSCLAAEPDGWRATFFFFFSLSVNNKVDMDVLTQWTEDVRACVCVSVGVCLRGCVHLRRFVSELRESFCALASRSGSPPRGAV